MSDEVRGITTRTTATITDHRALGAHIGREPSDVQAEFLAGLMDELTDGEAGATQLTWIAEDAKRAGIDLTPLVRDMQTYLGAGNE